MEVILAQKKNIYRPHVVKKERKKKKGERMQNNTF